MSETEQQVYCTESESESESESDYDIDDYDDSEEDPTFDVLEHTRSTLSKFSINKKSNHGSTKHDGDDDGLEVNEEVEVVVPELDKKDQKSYEAIQKLIQEGKVEKLKLDQCKIYLKKHGLRMSGKKDILIQRIKEHISILDGGGERKYPASSFVLNCKGDACMGDIVMFQQNVYDMFSIASRSATGPPCGTRTVAGRIIKESYGAAKQQHTFTVEVLWSKGEKPFPPLHPLLIKGRNLYRITTMRQKWDDEGERWKILSDKHARGAVARSNRDARVVFKSKRAPNGKSKHDNDKSGLAPPEQHQFKNQHRENNFHVNVKTEPIMQHSPHVQLQQQGWPDQRGSILQHPPQVQLQQGWHKNKNLQEKNHFQGNYNRGPIMQHPPPVKLQQERPNNAYRPKEDRFHGNRYFPANGHRMHHHHHQMRHPFTNFGMGYSRTIPYGGSMYSSNYMHMGKSSSTPYIQFGTMPPIDDGTARTPTESVTGHSGTYYKGRK